MKYYQCISKILLAIFLLLTLAVNADVQYPEITILNEGYVAPVKGREDEARLVASTVALIKAEGAIIIVDPGMVSAEVDLTNEVAKAGVKMESVTHVFISHHHPDHTIRIGMFPNATVIDFWASYKDDLWEDHGDHFQLAPNVTLIRTPGHTDEDASLVVKTKDGTYVFTHVWWNEKMEPKIDPLAEAQSELDKSRKIVLDIADFIIPGHGKIFRNPQR